MNNYKAIVDNVYHFIWTEMNQLDVRIDNPRGLTLEDRDKLILEREIYWKVLAHLDAAAAADRIRSYDEREKLRAETVD